MDRDVFDHFFCFGDVYIGPTILSSSDDGNWLGKVIIIPTKKNAFMESNNSYVGIREFNNLIDEELTTILKYLSIEKKEFDKFVNNYYLIEWQKSIYEKKPDISNLLIRSYL